MKLLDWIMVKQFRRDFPHFADHHCHAALQQAESIVASTGRRVRKRSVRVEFVSGERRFSNGWGWQERGRWVVGLCARSGTLIKVGHSPHRMDQPNHINYDVLLHEFVHHVLLASGYDSHHNPDFDLTVPHWRMAREVLGKTRTNQNEAAL